MAREETSYIVTTVYDEQAYAALTRLMMGKLRRWPRFVLVGTGALSIVGAGYLMFGEGRVSLPGALLLLAGNLFCMLGILAPRFAVRLMTASHKKGEPPVNTYRFDEAGVHVRTGELSRDYSYAFLTRVLEMSGYLFFFTRDGQAYLMRASDVREGYAAFRAYLEGKLAAARAAP